MDNIAVLDFGGQYTHLIANRVRRLGVYSEVLSPEVDLRKLKKFAGIILSGGPDSVYDKNAPSLNPEILELELPVLGICYGHQLMVYTMKGDVRRGTIREYGLAVLNMKTESAVFKEIPRETNIWMSHGDTVAKLPPGFKAIASTVDCEYAAIENLQRKLFGFQFHPEVTHTDEGMKMLSNFIDICNCKRTWNVADHLAGLYRNLKESAKGKKVFLLVSGGVDSTVAFALLNNALGKDRVFGLHIDTGLMRKGESSETIKVLHELGFTNLSVTYAGETFINALKGVYKPEEKRRIIGETFLDVKDREIVRFGLDENDWLFAQGTIYPDTIESGGTKNAKVIKTHHNRVDRIQKMIKKGLVLEPLASFYKDEVRKTGIDLGLPKALIWRHPFPGPGLGVRILCSDGKANPDIEKIENKVRNSFVLKNRELFVLPVQSVGVQGDMRTYAHPAVITGNMDFSGLEDLSTKITNAFQEINRVLLLLSSKTRLSSLRLLSCDVSPLRIKKAREADAVSNAILEKHGLMSEIWQMPVVLLPLTDEHGNEAIVLRPVVSQEAMTARVYALPENVVAEMAEELLSISGIGTVFYDITHKPPATIEWE